MTRRCALQAGHGGQCLPVKTALPEPMLGECRIAQTKIGRSASGNECAWCCAEFKVAPTPNVSHGICQRHADEMATRIAARKAAAG